MQRFCLPPPPSPPPRRQLAGSTNTRCGQMVMKERSRIPREVRAPLPFPPPFFKTGSLGDPVPRARAYPSRFSPLPSFERRKGEGSLPHRAACFSSRYFSFSSTPRGERHRCGRKKERKREKRKESCSPISLTLLDKFRLEPFLVRFDDNCNFGRNYPREESLVEIKDRRDRFSFLCGERRKRIVPISSSIERGTTS